MEENSLQVEQRDIAQVFENPENPRKHSDKQIEQIVASIQEFGFVNPILIDEQATIIAGHGRFRAAQSLGMKQVPTISVTGLTDDQKRALIIADNKIAINSTWDEDLLWQQIQSLSESDFDLTVMGFDEEQVIPFLAEEAFVSDLLEEWNEMPEFTNADQTAKRSIIVHFANEEDVQDFSRLLEQHLTDKTKFIWYPKQENMDTESKRYTT
mgnify:CR=1 FL=1